MTEPDYFNSPIEWGEGASPSLDSFIAALDKMVLRLGEDVGIEFSPGPPVMVKKIGYAFPVSTYDDYLNYPQKWVTAMTPPPPRYIYEDMEAPNDVPVDGDWIRSDESCGCC